ncbi:hypothetical protein ACWDUL_40530 [Nocardia niigatensis]|nr:hypothetical protein [Nocardia niigatensis]
MSDTTAQPAIGRNSVIWPDPSPLDSWWHRVMYTETSSAPQTLRMAR